MTLATTTDSRSRNLILTAMIFAVSMTFIDQTIISIAVPHIQRELGLSATGVQWAFNAYLLALAALFAFGGRLAGTLGHRRSQVTSSLTALGVPSRQAAAQAARIAQSQGGGPTVAAIPASCAWTSLTPRRPYSWSWPALWPPPHSPPSLDCVKDDSKNQASLRSHPNREHREKR